MAVEASLPQLGTVVFTALIDSINPCAIGVLILLLSTLLANYGNKQKMLLIGMAYIGAVFVTYLLAGLGLIYFFQFVPIYVAEYISIVVGLLIAIAGIIEIKDYFWYGQGFSLAISPERAKQIHNYTKKISIPGAIFLGAFVAAVELPCTGAPYLAIILMISQSFDITAFGLLILYNFIFVLPLLIILFMVYFGIKLKSIKKWKQSNRPYMRLVTGIVLVLLAWLLILLANGTINFG
jgi:cytochrome c biogenesis protein CcdA